MISDFPLDVHAFGMFGCGEKIAADMDERPMAGRETISYTNYTN